MSLRFIIIFGLNLVMAFNAIAASLSLSKKDLVRARLSPQASQQVVVYSELSDVGEEKLRQLPHGQDHIVYFKFADEIHKLKIKNPMSKQIQFGPFSKEKAEQIVKEINQN